MQHLKTRIGGSRMCAARHRSSSKEVPILIESQLSGYSLRALSEGDSLVDLEAPVKFALEAILEGAIYTQSGGITTHKPRAGLDHFELALSVIHTRKHLRLEGVPIQQSDIECGDAGGGECLIPELGESEPEGGAAGARPMPEAELDILGILLSGLIPKGRARDDPGNLNGGNGDFVSSDEGRGVDVGGLLFILGERDPTRVRDNREESDPRVGLRFVETGVAGRDFPGLGSGDSG